MEEEISDITNITMCNCNCEKELLNTMSMKRERKKLQRRIGPDLLSKTFYNQIFMCSSFLIVLLLINNLHSVCANRNLDSPEIDRRIIVTNFRFPPSSSKNNNAFQIPQARIAPFSKSNNPPHPVPEIENEIDNNKYKSLSSEILSQLLPAPTVISTFNNKNGNSSTISSKITFPSTSNYPLPPETKTSRQTTTSFKFPDDNSGFSDDGSKVRSGRDFNVQPKPQPEPKVNKTTGPEDTGRKASPDVQDIIDGIVKLLGGKVHNGNNNKNSQNQQQQMQNHQHQQQQNHQQQQQQQQHQFNRPPPPTPAQVLTSNRPYNLFQPNKPILFITPKPARINNRGPPIPLPSPTQPITSPTPSKPPPPTDQHFEVIPLEALSNNFNLSQTKFGPPFSLTKVIPGSEAPYKQGVQLPEQIVPTSGENSEQQESNRPFPTAPQNIRPHHSGEMQNGNIPFPQQGHKNDRPSPQHLPLQFNRYPSYLTSPKPETTSSRITSLLVPLSQSTPSRNQSSVTPRPGTVKKTTPLQSQLHTDSIEDDEKEQEVNPNLLTQNQNSMLLEPTMSEELPIQPPNTVVSSEEVSSSTSTFYEFSPMPSSSTYSSPDESINPTASSSLAANNFGPSSTTFPQPDLSPTITASDENNQFQYPSGFGTGSGSGLQTPELRPGIVIHETGPQESNSVALRPKPHAVGSVEVVTAEDAAKNLSPGNIGDVFDITVTAKQNFGGQVTGQPFIIPVDMNDEIITAPNGNQQFVSIDGKRTYFNLHANTAAPPHISPTSSSGIIAPHIPSTIPPVISLPSVSPTPQIIKSHPGIVGQPTHPFAQPSGIKNPSGSSRISTSLSITGSGNNSNGNKNIGTTLKVLGDNNNGPSVPTPTSNGSKTPPNIIRRPITRRPSIPPVRIDTCIVGDDSTCNSEQFESCRTESGVSSCMCRPGYARKRHREPCKAVVSLVLSLRLDKLGDKKLNYNPDYFNPSSEIYQTLEWETIHGLDSVLSDTVLQGGYIGAKLDAIGFDGRHAVVNSTVLIQEMANIPTNQVKREIQRQLIDELTRTRNNFGKSQLWVEGPISAINAIADVNECENPDLNDCDSKAKCINTYGSFECKCNVGYGDKNENDRRRSGRKCESCNSKLHCNGRGECLIENGKNICKCSGNYYGSQCDIDGEVLAVAIGASVSAIVIIGLTLACLCMWSRRWKREEQKAAIMSRTLFGGMASQALSYLSKNTMSSSNNPYQQHVTLDERLRWAQVNDPNLNGNIYVNEPMSLHATTGMLGNPLMDGSQMLQQPPQRRPDTCDPTIDDLFEERLHMGKRPKSRSSQIHNGSIYYDLEGEPQSEIYATRAPPTMLQYPAQFCVPMSPMNHYQHARGFYN